MADISNGSQLKGVVYGLYSPDSSTGKAVLDDVVVAKSVTVGAKAADAMASTATSETAIWTNNTGRSIRVLAVSYSTTAALTADNTNNAVITISSYTAAGGGKATVAVETTNVASGNWVAFTQKAITVTVANAVVENGGTLSLTIAKGGSGVVVPAGAFNIKYEYA